MGNKSKQTQKSSSTQTVAPPSWTMPGIADASARVTAALGQVPGTRYTGPFVAQPDAGLLGQAQGAYTGAAAQGNQLADWLHSAMTGLTGQAPVTTGTYNMGTGYDPSAAISAAVHPIMQQLTEQTLPGLRSSALESGAYSGDRAMSVLPQVALRDATESAQRVGAQIGLQAYNDNEARRLQAYGLDQGNALQAQQFNRTLGLNTAQLLPELIDQQMKLRTGAGDLYSAAMGLGTDSQQAGINDALARAQYDLQYPFQGLDIATQLLSQLSGNYGTTTSNGTNTVTQQTGGGLGGVVSGLAGLTGLIGGMPMKGGGTLLGSLFQKKA